MKTLKWKLTVPSEQGQSLDDASLKNVFKNYIAMGLASIHKEGMSSLDLRTFNKALDKLDDAKKATIKLEDAQFEIIKQAVVSGKYPPTSSSIVTQLLDFVEQAKDC